LEKASIERSRGADNVASILTDRLDKVDNEFRVMLPVAVHHTQHIALSGKESLNACVGKAPVFDPQNQPDSFVLPGQAVRYIGTAVRRIVVYEEDFPVIPCISSSIRDDKGLTLLASL
jgi:hypothetical protein